MNCSYCGRRVPGRLVLQGIKKCQGCGAWLPDKPTYKLDKNCVSPDGWGKPYSQIDPNQWGRVVSTDSGTDYDVTLHMLINQRTGVVIVYKETINAPFQNGKV
jgi:hypothetical protein